MALKKLEAQKRAMLLQNGIKLCPKCQRRKPTSEFHKNLHEADGYQSYCKTCAKIIRKPLVSLTDTEKAILLARGRTARDSAAHPFRLCPRCNNTLPFGAFPGRTRSNDGLYTYCRDCCRDDMNESRRAKDPEKWQRIDELPDSRCKVQNPFCQIFPAPRHRKSLQTFCSLHFADCILQSYCFGTGPTPPSRIRRSCARCSGVRILSNSASTFFCRSASIFFCASVI